MTQRPDGATVDDAGVVRPVHWFRPVVVGAVFLCLTALLSRWPRHSGNVWSRFATVESLVERGTLAIDDSPLRGSASVDVVQFRGRFYSDKPPMLSALGAVVYAPLAWAGIRFTGQPSQWVLVNWVLLVVIVGMSSAMAIVSLRRLLQLVDLPAWQADLLALAGGCCSLLFSYAVTFNNHSVAAGLLTAAAALVFCADHRILRRVPLAQPVPHDAALVDATGGNGRVGPSGFGAFVRPGVAGLMTALAATMDIPAGGAAWVALAACLAISDRPAAIWFLVGSAPPALLHCVLQSQVTGSPLPVECYPEAFNYPGSYWVNAGAWHEPGPRWHFGMELLVGPQGWLTVTPVLAFGLVGIVGTLRHTTNRLWRLASVVAVVGVVLIAYYVWGVRRTDFAGSSFGTRHLLAVTPLVYFFGVVAVARLRNLIGTLAFCVLMAASATYAYAGMLDPWSRIERRVAAGTDPVLQLLQTVVPWPWSTYSR
jgi:hypothetical protein